MDRKHSVIILLFFILLVMGIQMILSQNRTIEYGPLKIGNKSPDRPGDPTAYPYKVVPESNFYVSVVQKGLPVYCIFEDCGMYGILVECMGGWLTGDDQIETAEEFGVDYKKLKADKASMIIVADKNANIVGIYPNKRMYDLPNILKKHPDLSKYMDECFGYNLPPKFTSSFLSGIY